MLGTNLFAPFDTNTSVALSDSSGYAVIAQCTGAPQTTASKYQHGCIMVRTDSGTGTKALYENTGSVASPSWDLIGSTSAGEISLADGKMLVGNSSGVGAAVSMSGDVTITNAGAASIGAGKVTGAKLSAGKGYFTVAVDTTGTTPVNVFGAGGAPVALTVTSVTSIAKDTTASNIILKQAANTVATIAKGTTSGALVGAASLANAAYAAADVCTVESSGTGNSTVLITFTVA